LVTYQKASIIYDATVFFCDHYIERRSRTHDRMVQAARSGKQNIVEASVASGTSKETEIKLTNVARASLEELLEDYRDFLRTGGHELWDKNSKAALAVRRLAGQGRRKTGTIGTPGAIGTIGKTNDEYTRVTQRSQEPQGSQES
jgi:hypothetical protein